MKKDISFEEAMARLNDIVVKLETGDIPLDDSIKLFEEGAQLSAVCSKKLEQAEQKIKKITADGDLDSHDE